MREDHFTRTPEAAAAYARAHAETMDRDVPSPAELAEDAAELRARGPRALTEREIVHGDLVMDGLPLPPGVTLAATTGTAVALSGAPEAFLRRVVAWAEGRRDYDHLVRDDVVYLRRNGQPHPLHEEIL